MASLCDGPVHVNSGRYTRATEDFSSRELSGIRASPLCQHGEEVVIMHRQTVLFSIVGLCLVGLLAPTGCGKKKVGEGQLCKEHKECKEGLKCVNRRCSDFSGSHPACKWSLECLKKLAEKLPKDGVGYEISRFYKTLSGAPYKSDCLDMPSRIAALLNNRPWE